MGILGYQTSCCSVLLLANLQYRHILTFAEMRRILDDSEKITSKLVNINIAKKVLKSQKYENRLNDIIKRLDLLRKNAIFIMLVRIMSSLFTKEEIVSTE